MPAVKMVPIRDADGNVIDKYFEASNSFAESAQRNRMPMVRSDGKAVNVNKKLQARGHYDDKGYEKVRLQSKIETEPELTPGQQRTAAARAAAQAKREGGDDK